MFGRIANILGWAGVALVVASVAAYFGGLEYASWRQALALSGLGCILAYGLGLALESMPRRSAVYFLVAVLSAVIVLSILVFLNYFAGQYHKRWDVSAAKDFTLSDQTKKVIASLKAPLAIYVFDQTSAMQQYRDRLADYEYLSKLVQVTYVDPDKDPVTARKYQVQVAGTIIVEYQKRTERVTTGGGEQEITNAIIKAVQGQVRKAYFLTGHGEKSPEKTDQRTGYSAVSAELGRDNFTVATLALLQQPEVPADADVVIAAGPTNDYVPAEIDALRKYLNKGGKALFLIDPPDTPTSAPLTNLIAFAAEWGFEVQDNIVVDIGIRMTGGSPAAPVIASYPEHPITDRFDFYTMFPFARTVTPLRGAPRTPQPLLSTSPRSWTETDRDLNFDAASKRGPVELGAAIAIPAPDAPPTPPPTPGKPAPEAPRPPETRVVVIGDSDFASNAVLGFQGNANFFSNVVNWLAQQENLIAIRPKAPDDRRVTLTDTQLTMVTWLALVIVPGAIFAIGVVTWWRRRG